MAQDIFANTPEMGLRQKWALMQLQNASSTAPTTGLGAVARALQGAIGGYAGYQGDQEDKAAREGFANSLPGLGGTPAAPSAAPAPQAAAPSGDPQALAAKLGGSSPYSGPIANIESGGRYDLLGPVISRGSMAGDRAYGKYQVMGANVGPWTKQYLGQEMTPQAFAANPDAQEAVFKGEFGRLAQKHGPEGAARAWFAGEGGMNKPNRTDQLGTSVADYARKFNAGMGQQPVQTASLGPAAAPGMPAAPQMPPAGPQVAQNGVPGALPPQATNAPVPNRSSVQIPPDVAATIKKLLSDQRTAPQGMQLYMQYAKPVESIQPMTPEQRKQWNVPEGVSAGMDTVTGKPTFSQPANSVNVNTAANPLHEIVAKQVGAQRLAAQTAATQTIPAIHDARQALDDGAITGAFAGGRLDLHKVGALFGLDDSQAANTEVLSSAVGSGVLAHIRELGANPSNADRDYIEKVQGGKIALEEKSIRKILDIQERYARQAIKNFNRDSSKLMGAQGGSDAYKSIAPLMSFEEPPQYQRKAAPTSSAPAATSNDGWKDIGNGVRIREKK